MAGSTRPEVGLYFKHEDDLVGPFPKKSLLPLENIDVFHLRRTPL